MNEEADLCQLVDMEVGDLRAMVKSLPDLYHRFALPKASGGRRWILAPAPVLKRVQRRLLRRLLYRLKAHPAAHGFVPNRSIVTNARSHVGHNWVLALDIEDFFPSVPFPAIAEVIEELTGLSEQERTWVRRLVTHQRALPQGAPTSPYLANLSFRGVDAELSALSISAGLVYTRYADDLSFSGECIPPGFVAAVQEQLSPAGYRLASAKTRFMGRHTRQTVTGLVVNEKLQLPRPLRRWLRAVLYDIGQRGLPAALSRSPGMSQARLLGYLALWEMADSRQARREIAALVRLTGFKDVAAESVEG